MRVKHPGIQERIDRLRSIVLDGPGHTRIAERQAAAGTGSLRPGPVDAYLEKVRRQAAEIDDLDVAALQAAGMTDDEIFELTVAAAVGAASRRLEAGLSALDAVYGPKE